MCEVRWTFNIGTREFCYRVAVKTKVLTSVLVYLKFGNFWKSSDNVSFIKKKIELK